MKVSIDKSAGFCWGVVRTIDIAEKSLSDEKEVYVLGSIIHNPKEINRLKNIGLHTVDHEELPELTEKNAKVIIRAHGEPPSTYKKIKDLGIELIDATCPLVTALQKRVHKYYKLGYQIVIYGKREHAEVIGLRGVCNDECIVVRDVDDALEKVDKSKKTILFSQTTMDKRVFEKIEQALNKTLRDFNSDLDEEFTSRDTICKYVWGREEKLAEFARANDAILFVAGRRSSNGKSLFNFCKIQNDATYFIEDVSEIDYDWFVGAENIGVTGATSTPQWYLKLVKEELENYFKSID